MARRDDAVDAFVERFAGDLEIAGIPRQPARVFVALLATDDGYLSSAQLGERLRISPAAVSAAIRYLVQVHLVRREREPGTRRDRYRVTDDAWFEAAVHRAPMLERWIRTLTEGERVLGRGTPAADRMHETLEFMEFLHAEMPAVLARWRRRRRSAAGDLPRRAQSP